MLDSHISTYFNKDTSDLFMLCIVLMCQLYCVLFIIVVRFILLLLDFHSSLFDFCFYLILLLFHCSLFVVQRKKIQFWSWIVFQVFRSCCTIVHEVPSSYHHSEYGVQLVYIYQQNGFKKRENTDQSISVKKRLSGPQHTNEFSSMLKKLETIKMFFTAVEIVPFEGVYRNLRGWVPFGVESILQYICWVPF